MRKWLKELRKEKNLTQAGVAGELGLSQSYYSEIENGCKQADLSLSTVMKLSEILGVTVDFVIEKENALKGEG